MKKMTATFLKKSKKNFFMLFFVFLFLNVGTINVFGQSSTCLTSPQYTLLTETTVGECVCTLVLPEYTYDISYSLQNPICEDYSLADWNFTYVLDGATTGNGSNTLIGVILNKGITGVIWTAVSKTDPNNTITFTKFYIDVKDRQPPKFDTLNHNITVNNDPNMNGAVVEYSLPGATDNCSTPSVYTKLTSLSSGSFFPIGTTDVEIEAIDLDANISTTTFSVTVIDNEPPVLILPPNVVDFTYIENGRIIIYNVTATDNSGLPVDIVKLSGPASGELFWPILTTVTYQATDAAGNVAIESFTVTIVDNVLPIISCPSVVWVSNVENTCYAKVAYNVTATDNCPLFLTIFQTDGPAKGTLIPVGASYSITMTASDTKNTVSCTFVITAFDMQPPTVSTVGYPIDQNVIVDPAICGQVIEYSLPTATDNCSNDVTITGTQIAGLASGEIFPIGITTNKIRYSDTHGNSDTIVFTVTVSDVAPAITCPPAITEYVSGEDFNLAASEVDLGTPIGLSLCYTNLSNDAPDVYTQENTVVTWTLQNNSGATATCEQIVTLVLVNPPTLTLPADMSLINDPSVCGATVIYATPTFTGTDAVMTQVAGLPSDTIYPIGTTTNTFIVTDAYGQSSMPKSFTVTVLDKELPIITVPQNATALINTPYFYPAVTATDNCGVTVNQIAGQSSGTIFPAGITTTNTWVATDASGNKDTASFNVFVNNAPIVVTIAQYVMPELCGGGCTLTVNPQGNDYTYLWSTGETTAVIKITVAGTYTVAVTNTHTGQTGTGTIIVTVDYITGSISSYVLLAWDKISLMGVNVYTGGVGTLKPVTSDVNLKKTSVFSASTFVKSPTVTVQDGSVVTNQIIGTANVVLPAFEYMTLQSAEILKIPNNTTYYVTGSLYKQIEVGKGSTAVFTETATYIQNNVKMAEGSIMKFAQCGKIIIGNELNTQANCIINPDEVGVTFYDNNNMIFGKNNKVTGTFYSKSLNPNAPNPLENLMNVQISDQNDHGVYKGIFMAQMIDIKGNNDLYLNQNCDYCPAYNPVTFTAPSDLTLCYDEGSIKVRDLAPEQLIGVISITTNQPAIFPVGLTKVTWTVIFKNGTKILYPQNVIRVGPTNVTIAESGSFLDQNKVLTASYTGIQVVSYKWSTLEITPSINIVEPGIYTVTATTVNGCDIVSSILVQLSKNYNENNVVTDELADMVLYNYPNPFNNKTTIRFILPEDNFVTLQVYDLTGKLIQILYRDQAIKNQEYNMEFDGSKISAGIYIYKMSTNNKVLTGKITKF